MAKMFREVFPHRHMKAFLSLHAELDTLVRQVEQTGWRQGSRRGQASVRLHLGNRHIGFVELLLFRIDIICPPFILTTNNK